jgi:hypothetical protein
MLRCARDNRNTVVGKAWLRMAPKGSNRLLEK